MEVKVHDIVYLKPNKLIDNSEILPEWVLTEKTARNIAVVRRMKTMDNIVPIGFRGKNRSERFASLISKENIYKVITPEKAAQETAPVSHKHTIDQLRGIFKDTRWGIGGSIGFTMATGIQACTPRSDIDIILYSEKFEALQQFKNLYEKVQKLDHQIDIQIEVTGLGACLLNEIVTSPIVLLRTATGVFLIKTNQLFCE